MIQHIELTNFKTFEKLDIPLGQVTILAGPNNSGKTTLLQALTLWDIALRKWWDQKASSKAKERKGVTINRQDLYAIPIPEAKLLWHNIHTRSGAGENSTVYMIIQLEGLTHQKSWKAALQFYYANPESLYARPVEGIGTTEDLQLALYETMAYLPPMSGLSAFEERLEEGSIRRRIGEGRTAEVLRNLLWKIYDTNRSSWELLCKTVQEGFGAELLDPVYNQATSIITCSIQEEGKPVMDLSTSGRGFQQFLLLYSYLFYQPHTVLMLDEPDAHLEYLRQQGLYRALVQKIKEGGTQLLIATHSEAILDLAFEHDDTVIAFIRNPHPIRKAKTKELKKALLEIPAKDYLLAEEQQRILYLEGSTDLALLKAFAKVLRHPVAQALERAWVIFINTNNLDPCRSHFTGLQEEVPELQGLLLTDNLGRNFEFPRGLVHLQWQRNEIECYLPLPDVLYRYYGEPAANAMELIEATNIDTLQQIIQDETIPAALRDKNHDFWKTTKISDDWLAKILARYYKELQLPVQISKGEYYRFAEKAQPNELDPEIKEKLDSINNFLS